MSLPAWPNTCINAVLATDGVPPSTGTAPPLTRIWPAALRLIATLLSRLSPNTVSTPAEAAKVAVTAWVVTSPATAVAAIGATAAWLLRSVVALSSKAGASSTAGAFASGLPADMMEEEGMTSSSRQVDRK